MYIIQSPVELSYLAYYSPKEGGQEHNGISTIQSGCRTTTGQCLHRPLMSTIHTTNYQTYYVRFQVHFSNSQVYIYPHRERILDMSKRARSNNDEPASKRLRIEEGNQTSPALCDKQAWGILQQFLTTDMTMPEMDNTLPMIGWNPDVPCSPGEGDDSESLVNLNRLMARHVPPAPPSPASKTVNRLSNSRRKRSHGLRKSTHNPYIIMEAEDDDEDGSDEEEAWRSESEQLQKAIRMSGPSAKEKLAKKIDDLANRFKENSGNSSQCRHGLTSRAALIPLSSLEVSAPSSRMYLLHIQRTAVEYIAEHLRNQKFSVTVSPWVAGQIYVVADSPKSICDSLPASHGLAVKQCLRITDAEREAVVGQSYYMGLLLQDFHRDNLELLASPHIDDIRLHLESGWDKPFLKKTVASFSMQFLRMGDWARVVEGALRGESGQVISTDHTVGSASLEFAFDGRPEQIEVRVEEIERVFRVGDTVKVVAGPYLGIEGHIIQMRQDVFDICQDITNKQVEVSKYYLDRRPLNHTMHSQIPMQQYLEPPPESDSIEIGDYIEVLDGRHMGKRGVVDWYAKRSTYLWFRDVLTQDGRETSSGLSSISVPVAMVRRTSLTHTIQYTKDKGYDVRPGDVVTVARGPEYQAKGVVHSVDIPNAHLTILCDSDRSLQRTGLKLHKVATKYGMRLNGAMLEGPELTAFCEMRKRSYLAPPPRSTTPPVEKEKIASSPVVYLTGPSSSPSNAWSTWSESLDVDKAYNPTSTANPTSLSTHDPWAVDTQNAEAENLPDNSPIPWLMSKDFSLTLSTYHVLLKVSPNFLHACPDSFCGENGQAPEGHVAAFCTSNGAGAAIEHHHIPASDLSPAPPCKKNQQCLVLDGAHRGALGTVVNCWTKKKTVDLRLSETVTVNLGFDQLCLVEPAKHMK
ncbi:uncharacterized protein F5891DRAFT_986285 [Suillus fuscotomentosus]|uniref:KOW domain-containing protein n=1 Tax=Suillus fuscotomentosus TaxID=1912939 RepID=A0AAD4HE88_9AGAM|nr:uncharacterized protein F5891DRAFT_986285 [Suillus fuscotomentosus]KAG1892961.1 hypothetical protein F5891DRAFT_986285 [Suillus fuscotomentosus]